MGVLGALKIEAGIASINVLSPLMSVLVLIRSFQVALAAGGAASTKPNVWWPAETTG